MKDESRRKTVLDFIPPPVSLILLAIMVVTLPVAGYLARRHQDSGCALDGVQIDPLYRVKVIDGQGDAHLFCCIRCAQLWLKQKPTPPRAVAVTDEENGQEIEARSAWYVRSSVVTTPATGNRVHVFRSRADAEKHADKFAGTVLSEAETPFR